MKPVHVRVGAQPINWINDDFKDLGAETSLETCLGEMAAAGFAGTQLGHRFPDDPKEILEILHTHRLRLASGWHSTYLAEASYDQEEERFDAHAAKLRACGADVVIVAECTHAVHGDGKTPLWFKDSAHLDADGRARVHEGLERLALRARSRGMKVAYHEHMGTVVQTEAEIDALMAGTRELSLVLDTGHLTFAGVSPLSVLQKYGKRIAHVHLKNIRESVVADVRAQGLTFEQAVRAGAFTVPGDGGIDFTPIFAALDRLEYRGWFVVEAEQDPKKANPYEYAKKARAYVREKAGV